MNKSNDSDASIKAGADLLLKGWKMLNKACPDCMEPLYEKEGKVVCVKCKKQYIMVDSAEDMPQKSQPQSTGLPKSVSSFDFSSLPSTLTDTAKIMMNKISDLNNRLKETSDPKEITELSSSIRSLVDSLRSLTS
ncbi:hypothetical protein EU534_00575 [Candidatus Heimdallarchaeota archaeon]|nr:MAG: hypothetical protein EU534_00575 [Candidatus Heimdallarchaeota archaeon]